MIALPALRLIVRVLSSFLVALLLVGLGQIEAGDPNTALPVEPLSLEAQASFEREIHGGEMRSFDLRIDAGTFVELEVAQRGVRISSRVLNSGEVTIAEGEGRTGPGSQLLPMITVRTDTYRLELASSGSPSISGHVKILVRAMRPAVAGDELRVKAAKTLVEARRLAVQTNVDSSLQALAHMEKSLALWRATGDGRGEIEALVEIALFHKVGGDLRLARLWYQKAFDRSREIGFDEGEGWALVNMGDCDSQLSEYDQAIMRVQQSLEVWQQAGGLFEQAFTLIALGNVYERKQDLQGALSAYEKALDLAANIGDLTMQAKALAGLGAVHYRQYRFGQSREIWERALDLSKRVGDVASETSIEQNLAAVYQSEGQLQKALEMYIRVAARKPARDSGMTRYNMGNLYFELGDPDKALESYELSQAAFNAAGSNANEVNALIGIGRVLQLKGDAQKALSTYERAKHLAPGEPRVLHSIALARIDLGMPEEALSLLESALVKIRENPDRWIEAAIFLAMGRAKTKLGQPEQAAEHFTEAITLGKESGYQRVVALALLQRALLHREHGRSEAALADVETALAVIESNRRSIVGDQLRTGFSAAKRTYYDLSIDLQLQLDRLHPDRGYRARALEATERARARGLLDLLAEGRIDLSQGLDPDLRRQEDAVSDQISQVQRELRAGGTEPERLAKLRAEIDTLNKRRELLEVEIQSKNKRYADVRYPVPLKLEEIQKRVLDESSVLLEYALGEQSSTLFVITREQIKTYELPDTAEIAPQVLRLRKALEKESLLTRRSYLEAAFQLYQVLLEPAAATLAGKSNLLIVPDGVLHYLPFEALLTENRDLPYRNLPYLLRRFAVTYIPSASVLAGLREPRREPVPEKRKQVVAFAPFASPGKKTVTRGLELESASRWSFSPLPASGREVSEIAALYPESAQSFIGADADESTVAHDPAVAAARRLHFATHAQIDERRPEYSALVLAERSGEDGLLQAREIFNLKLSADLAVLSACQTALGKEVTGEGLIGLSRAFFYAGVPSLVVSLWNVVDGPTPELMLDFYRNLDRLNDKTKALQTAKLSMLDRGFSHPSYWAPFILLGEPH